MNKRVKLEVCVDSLTSAITARAAGADRLELCSELSVGGLTPSAGLIRQVRKIKGIALNVLIRPRSGDFCYTETELRVMAEDIRMAAEAGADGVVIGALNPDGTPDMEALSMLVEAAGDCSVTFHRAFELIREPLLALEEFIGLGIARILTSGQAQKAEDGIPMLRRLIAAADGRIIIMPGSGINAANAGRIVRETGAVEIHASAKRPVSGHAAMGSRFGFGGEIRWQADEEEIKTILERVNNPEQF